jgi:GNAT superfamily N-acetyltransferase
MVTIAPLGRDRSRQAAELMAKAFAEDGLVSEMTQGLQGRKLADVFQVELEHVGFDTVDGAWDKDGTLLGLGAWESPHTGRRDWSWGERWRLWRALGRRLGTWRSHLEAFETYRPTVPHWYLSDLVVDPEAHGRGVGSALLRQRLARVDVAGLPAYLESTTVGSRRLYRRFGFEPIAPLPGFEYPDSRAMLRPGRRPAEAVQS